MDVIIIILVIIAFAMCIMTFLQSKRLKQKKMRYAMQQQQMQQMQQQPNPYGLNPFGQQPSIEPVPMPQQQFPEGIRQSTQNINKTANKNYQQVYGNLVKEMREQKQIDVKNKQTEIAQQVHLHDMLKNKKEGREFGRSVDLQNWERKNLYGINENKQPMEKVEFLEPKLEQQQFWSQNQPLVWGILGFSGFILFLILVT